MSRQPRLLWDSDHPVCTEGLVNPPITPPSPPVPHSFSLLAVKQAHSTAVAAPSSDPCCPGAGRGKDMARQPGV